MGRLKAAGLTWPLPEGLSEAALEPRLYRAKGEVAVGVRELDWEHVHAELARKHVTLMLLWGEYNPAQPEGYQYSWFCERCRSWAPGSTWSCAASTRPATPCQSSMRKAASCAPPTSSWPCSGQAA